MSTAGKSKNVTKVQGTGTVSKILLGTPKSMKYLALILYRSENGWEMSCPGIRHLKSFWGISRLQKMCLNAK